jgi:hypothetical protein
MINTVSRHRHEDAKPAVWTRNGLRSRETLLAENSCQHPRQDHRLGERSVVNPSASVIRPTWDREILLLLTRSLIDFETWIDSQPRMLLSKESPQAGNAIGFSPPSRGDLWHKYPAFRTALSNVINNNPSVVEMRAYTTLFESLLRDPLKDVDFAGPVLIVIDALDESEDASGNRLRNTLAFHDFLATRLRELPSNFRILITSRPELAS